MTRSKSCALELQLIVARHPDKRTPAENLLETSSKPAANKTLTCSYALISVGEVMTDLDSPAIEAAVDDGIVHGGAHCKPQH